MIIHNCEQGSEEWFVARCGAVSASRFKDARSRLKRKSGDKQVGDFTDSAEDYAFKVAVERIIGESLDADQFTTHAMKRGNELEPAARARHAMEIGQHIEQIGIAKSDDERFAASPDGFIGEDGGSEYKCLVAPSSLRKVLLKEDISDYIDQIQGGMWLCDREWWDFVLYAPQLELIGLDYCRKRVFRDDKYIKELEADLKEFDVLVEQTKETLIKLGEVGWCDSHAA